MISTIRRSCTARVGFGRPGLKASEAQRRRCTMTIPNALDLSFGSSPWRPIEALLHLRSDPVAAQGFLVFPAQERILHAVWDGGAALGDVDRAFVGILLARNAGLVLAMVVGAVPADQPQRLAADAEMSMEPVAAEGRGRDEADRFV